MKKSPARGRGDVKVGRVPPTPLEPRGPYRRPAKRRFSVNRCPLCAVTRGAATMIFELELAFRSQLKTVITGLFHYIIICTFLVERKGCETQNLVSFSLMYVD